MSELHQQPCQACRRDAPDVPENEYAELLLELPEWTVQVVAAEPQLKKVYAFKNFAEALNFTNQVGALAESVNHHPMLVTEWGRVEVRWWTHKIGGLHKNDFILAAKTDRLFSSD